MRLKLNILLCCIFIICLYAVTQIKLDWFLPIGSIKNADSVNSIIENLSYSYITAYIFFLLTIVIPSCRRKKKISPILRSKVKNIGAKNIRNILLEFARETDNAVDYKNIESTADILNSKNWDTEIPIFKTYRHLSITYFRYINLECRNIKEQISAIIIRYKEDMTEDQIVALEEFYNISLFYTLESLCSFPVISVNDGKGSLIDDFVSMQKKFLELEKSF